MCIVSYCVYQLYQLQNTLPYPESTTEKRLCSHMLQGRFVCFSFSHSGVLKSNGIHLNQGEKRRSVRRRHRSIRECRCGANKSVPYCLIIIVNNPYRIGVDILLLPAFRFHAMLAPNPPLIAPGDLFSATV